MAITYPIDLLSGWPGSAALRLVFRQEIAPERGGQQNSADIGDPLWELTAQSRPLKPNEIRYWKARLALLENGARTFYGYDLTSCYPIAEPGGWGSVTWPGGTEGRVNVAAGSSGFTLNLKNMPATAAVVLSVGDLLAIDYDSTFRSLHRIVDIPDNVGATRTVEVRPALPAGVGTDDVVYLFKPSAIMCLIPDSVQTPDSLDGRGVISFAARQTPST